MMRPPNSVQEFASIVVGMTLDQAKDFMNKNVPGLIRIRQEGDTAPADRNPNRLNVWLNENNVVIKVRVG